MSQPIQSERQIMTDGPKQSNGSLPYEAPRDRVAREPRLNALETAAAAVFCAALVAAGVFFVGLVVFP